MPETDYVFIDYFTYVSGTSDQPMLAIDFPMYRFNSATGTLQYFMSLNLTESTQVILGSGMGLGGEVGMKVSTQLACYDNLLKPDSFDVSTDGSALFYYKEEWISLPPGATFRDNYGTTQYMGFEGQLNVEFRVTNYGILSKANVLAPNLPTPGPTPVQALCGDVNNDGVVSIVDALIVVQYYVNLAPPVFDASRADVNGDGIITIIDALMIAQYYVGLVKTLNC